MIQCRIVYRFVEVWIQLKKRAKKIAHRLYFLLLWSAVTKYYVIEIMDFSKKTPSAPKPSSDNSGGVLSGKIRLLCLLLIVFICLSVTCQAGNQRKGLRFGKGHCLGFGSRGRDPPFAARRLFSASPADDPATDRAPQTAPFARELDGQLKRGESLDALLSRLEVPQPAKDQVVSALRQCLDFRNLKPKDKISVRLDDQDQLHSCTYEVSPFEIYDVSRQQDSYLAARRAVELKRHIERISGKVSASLFQAFSDLDEKPVLVYAFADIFSSKIDFNTETRTGDYFNAIVEKYYKDGNFIGYGRILFASYHLLEDDRTYNAYSFENDGNPGYFNGQGEELGTSFLRSPVPIGRVTSRFTFHRKHPITGVVRPHLGVDLAAPIGTPIMAAADGKVIFAGRRGGFGNQIILQHGNGYKTYYGHLSRFARGVRRGSAVHQKEIIGYVGSTGDVHRPASGLSDSGERRLQKSVCDQIQTALHPCRRGTAILPGHECAAMISYLADSAGNRHLIEAKKITTDAPLPKILL